MSIKPPGNDRYGYPPTRLPPKTYPELGGCFNLWLGASAIFGVIALGSFIQLWNFVFRSKNAFQLDAQVPLCLRKHLFHSTKVLSLKGVSPSREQG
jgi:hypothetical protein